jgi:hypothetical protein
VRNMDKLLCIITGGEHNGTTYFENIIYSHPEVFGGFETGILLDENFNKCKPFCDWIYSGGPHWGLREDIKLDGKSFKEKYDLLFKYKGSGHATDHTQKLIYDSKYIVDKTPAYIRNLEFVRKNVPSEIPILIIIKNFKGNFISKVVKRAQPISVNIDQVKYVIDSLKYIKNSEGGKNIHLFYYDDVIEYHENFIMKIKNILKYKIDTNVELSLEKYEEKLKNGSRGPAGNWKQMNHDVDEEKLIPYIDIRNEYDGLILELKEDLKNHVL